MRLGIRSWGKIGLSLSIVFGLLAVLYLGFGDAVPQSVAADIQRMVVDEPGTVAVQGTTVMTVYLPLVMRNYPPPPTIFGVQMHSIDDAHGFNHLQNAGNYWIRINAFSWDKIDPNNTEYDWTVVDETSLRNAADAEMEVIAVVRFTPEWAQKYNGSYCGPIAKGALADFADFLTALVNRYKASPYNVQYWELGNEPDVPVWYNHSAFGCWGEESDEYYGGGYYAEMLKVAYPAIKAADPQAQVLIGGLLLDCDPNDVDCSNPKPARFLEGILRNGGGDYFDIVSFHGYPPYDGSLQQDENFASWNERGGVGLGKIAYLREVMAKYGVDKPLIHTEGSLICPEWNISQCNPPDSAFYETQADYVVWLFVRNWAQGVLGTTWYQFEGPGWRYGSMLDANQDPKPAYDAYKFLTEELGEAVYVSELTQYADLRAYEFSAPGKRIWVLWAPDEQSHSISLPSTLNKAYDKYGNDITPAGDTMEINHPVYLELAP